MLAQERTDGCDVIGLTRCHHSAQLDQQPLSGADKGTRRSPIGARNDGRCPNERLGDAQAVANAVPQGERLMMQPGGVRDQSSSPADAA
jgi:hypothetical protein